MFSNPHNLVTTPRTAERRYGIRVRLAENDPFRRLVDEGWETFHWFEDAAERDAALENMRRLHQYSRLGDVPTLRYEPVDS